MVKLSPIPLALALLATTVAPAFADTAFEMRASYEQQSFTWKSLSNNASLIYTAPMMTYTVIDHTGGQPTLETPFFPNDPDGDPMSATCNNNPSDFTVVVNTNPNPGSGATVEPTHPVWALDITVENPNFSDPSVFQCTVRDSFGATAVSNVTITRSD